MNASGSIRIVLAADVHLGQGAHKQRSLVGRQRLVEERMQSLHRAVQLANEHKAHFIVIAGDLFHKTKVDKALVDGAVDALSRFQGADDDGVVLVLPGNHDYCADGESELWTGFQRRVEEVRAADRVMLLLRGEVHSHSVEGVNVEFFPCPCPSKHSESHAIGWVRGAPKTPGALHVGIAHGNVDGLGLDAEGKYFNMSRAELAASGVHCWLLGHIHVPSPDPNTVAGSSPLYMPGTTTPDDVGCRSLGHAWLLEFGVGGCRSHKLLTTGGVRFVRLSREMRDAADLKALMQEVESTVCPGDVVLELKLSGTLPADDQQRVGPWIDRIKGLFIDLAYEASLVEPLDEAAIDRDFIPGTIKYRLLKALLDSKSPAGDLHRACEAFKEAVKE